MASKDSHLWAMANARARMTMPFVGRPLSPTNDAEGSDDDLAGTSSDGSSGQPDDAAGPELADTPDAPRAIVVALDSSESARKVLASALRLARGTPTAAVHLLHVFRTSRLDHARAGIPKASATAMEEAKEAHLEAHVCAARRQSRGRIVGHFALGDPAAEILRLCTDLKADLLVVGTDDHRGLERFLLGSIAETLVRKAPCPVLVVRERRLP